MASWIVWCNPVRPLAATRSFFFVVVAVEQLSVAQQPPQQRKGYEAPLALFLFRFSY